jgi:hypothetical protein
MVAGTGFGGMRVNVGKTDVDLGDAVRIGGMSLLGQQTRRARHRP